MSVFIKGLTFPKDRPVMIVINPSGVTFVDHVTYSEELEAVDVPGAHGPLIDAAELSKWANVIPTTEDGGVDINDLEEYLDNAPAIIEAEEGEE